MKILFQKLSSYFPLFLLLSLAFWLMFFKLGQNFLFPWDEAWYADISRNILNSSELFLMQHNGRPYYDHPPLGFWLISITFKIFGINEFAARLPMALVGSLSVGLIYLIGKKLHSVKVGFISALILLSSRWFLLRSRTANLDSLLIFCQLSFFYFVISANNTSGFYLLWAFFGASLLTKSVISLTLFPLLIYKTWNLYSRKQIKLNQILIGIFLCGLIVLPFYLINYSAYDNVFLERSLITIGGRGLNADGVGYESLSQTFLYLNSAIHKWYKPFFLSLGISFFFIFHPSVRIILVYLVLNGFPYLVSSHTEIWHLIPVIAPIALTIGISGVLLIDKINKFFKNKILEIFLDTSFLVCVVFISFISIKSYWIEFINNPSSTPEVVKLAKITTDSNLPLVVSDDQFLPSVVFYSTPPNYVPPKTFYSLDKDYKNCLFSNTYNGRVVSLWNGLTENECEFSDSFLLISSENFYKHNDATVIAKEGNFVLLQIPKN